MILNDVRHSGGTGHRARLVSPWAKECMNMRDIRPGKLWDEYAPQAVGGSAETRRPRGRNVQQPQAIFDQPNLIFRRRGELGIAVKERRNGRNVISATSQTNRRIGARSRNAAPSPRGVAINRNHGHNAERRGRIVHGSRVSTQKIRVYRTVVRRSGSLGRSRVLRITPLQIVRERSSALVRKRVISDADILPMKTER